MINIILFLILFCVAVYFFYKRIRSIRKNIFLGKKKVSIDTKGGWKQVFLFAFGQKKMFTKPLVAIMHFIIYAGFFIINVEVLEILLDGLTDNHRIFLNILPISLYHFLINSFELLAVGVIFVCVVFLLRRNIINIARLVSNDLKGWPKRDANLILVFEIFLMSLFLLMNGTDTLLQQRLVQPYGDANTGQFIVSSMLIDIFSGFTDNHLVIMERAFWWLHIGGILGFLVYVTYSKHLHIFLAFPSAYYSGNDQSGKMTNMKNIEKEVALMLNPELENANSSEENFVEDFGAKDVQDLSWKQIMDAYSCTECGRCSSACPANLTGKKLSPRKIMMDVRDRADEVGQLMDKKQDEKMKERTLLQHYITEEELNACTTCQACIDACPVMLDPLSIILDLRRNLVMEQSNIPQEWITISNNMENNSAPWQFPIEEKEKWTQE